MHKEFKIPDFNIVYSKEEAVRKLEMINKLTYKERCEIINNQSSWIKSEYDPYELYGKTFDKIVEKYIDGHQNNTLFKNYQNNYKL